MLTLAYDLSCDKNQRFVLYSLPFYYTNLRGSVIITKILFLAKVKRKING